MAAQTIDELDAARAQEYALLSVLLALSPDEDLLGRLGQLRGDDSALGRAHGALAVAAGRTDVSRVQQEYFRLFVGVGRGELLPYASYYRTGALHGRPLVDIREAFRRVGLERVEGRSEPEDHAAILLEVMAGLLGGTLPAPPGTDREIFEAHIAPWMGRFFSELEVGEPHGFYATVGLLGRTFVEIERRAYLLQQV
jgi:TorA maturation chaperone TorD